LKVGPTVGLPVPMMAVAQVCRYIVRGGDRDRKQRNCGSLQFTISYLSVSN
jgi:hypothetical protein